MLSENGISASTPETKDFIRWMTTEAWNNYQKDRMDKKIIVKNRIDSHPIVIPNATKGKHYSSPVITLPTEDAFDFSIEGPDELGLIALHDSDGVFKIAGTPQVTGDFHFTLRYKYHGWLEGEPLLERKIPFAVNPNPRDLWKDIPTPTDIQFFKEDCEAEQIIIKAGPDGSPRKDMVAASKRGRSHAQEGKARDDHFRLFHSDDNDWYIIAVADGAGSARFSRKGSEVACNTVVDFCKTKLADASAFEEKINNYRNANDEETARKILGDAVYSIVGNAAFMAHKAINALSDNVEGTKPKDFATTLLLAICKKFDFGWFVASFWVGDGAMCIYNREKHTARLLGVPDEGEFSGQTRFLTMPEIFRDARSLYQRLRFGIVPDFTALMLMTDGVSDPMFGTEANLNNIDRWDDLWDKLSNGFPEDDIPGVDLSDDNENVKEGLLKWLDFWKPGEHDDRTIAILY